MQTILETKLYRPALAPDLVARPRLSTEFDRALAMARFMLVCAPAGYGKTTAVAAWLDHVAGRSVTTGDVVRCAWYSLDENDNDLRQFLKYLVVAFRLSRPDSLPGTWQLINRPQLPDTPLVLALLNEEISALPGRTIIVLDDFHVITEPAIFNFLVLWLRHKPPALFPVITSRYELPFSIALWRARNELGELRAAELAFTGEESLAFIRATVEGEFPPDAVSMLHERTEGWASGLRLASLGLRRPETRDQFLDSFRQSSHQDMVDYLVDEVLDKQPPERQRFLVATSLLDRLNSDLCAAILETSSGGDCQAILEALERENAFIFALDARRGWYRYHHLFQSLLQNRLAAQMSSVEIAAIHERAGRWLADHSLVEESLYHFHRAGDPAAMIAVVESRITDLQNSEAWSTLERWLGLLSREQIEARPALVLAECWLAQQCIAREAIWAGVDRVVALLANPENPWPPAEARRYGSEVHALRASHFYRHLPIAERAANARLALRDLPADKTWIRGFVLLNLMYQVTDPASMAGNLDLIETELRAVGPGPSVARIRSLFAKIGMIYSYGALADLRQPAEELMFLTEQIDMPVTRPYGRIALGMIAYLGNDCAGSIEHLEAVLADPYRINVTNFLMAANPLAAAYIATGQAERCDDILAMLRRRYPTTTDPAMREELDGLQAFIAHRRGDVVAARRWAARTFLPVTPTFHHNKPFTLAEIRLATGSPAQWQAAKAELEAYIAQCEALYERTQHIRALVLLAITEWHLGLVRPALDHLAASIDMGFARGFRRWYIDQGPIMGEMLHALARERRYVDEAGVLLAFLASAAGRPVATTPPAVDTIPPLSERELDILELLAEGLSNKEIAVKLAISPLTVRNHAQRIYHKLGVATRRMAVARAQSMGLLA